MNIILQRCFSVVPAELSHSPKQNILDSRNNSQADLCGSSESVLKLHCACREHILLRKQFTSPLLTAGRQLIPG